VTGSSSKGALAIARETGLSTIFKRPTIAEPGREPCGRSTHTLAASYIWMQEPFLNFMEFCRS
jgi:hypothetical protein